MSASPIFDDDPMWVGFDEGGIAFFRGYGPPTEIYNTLKATLHEPTDPKTKAKRLADNMVSYYEPAATANEKRHKLRVLWEYVIPEIAERLPSGHSWQTSLLGSLLILRERDDFAEKVTRPDGGNDDEDVYTPNEDEPIYYRKDLKPPERRLREWNLFFIQGFQSRRLPHKEVTSFPKRKNIESFNARMMAADGDGWSHWGDNYLNSAFGEPPAKGNKDCRLFLASEWIIRHARKMNYEWYKEHGKWDWWAKCLSEHLANPDEGIEDATITHMRDALNKLEAMDQKKSKST